MENKNDSVIKKMQHSLFFVNYILQEWKYLSVLELSRKFRVSDKMIWNIIRNIHCI